MQQYLEAGKVVTTHGVRGEMKLELWCDGVDFLKKAGRLFPSAQGGRAYKITSIRPQGQMALLQLEGVNDMDAARALISGAHFQQSTRIYGTPLRPAVHAYYLRTCGLHPIKTHKKLSEKPH